MILLQVDILHNTRVFMFHEYTNNMNEWMWEIFDRLGFPITIKIEKKKLLKSTIKGRSTKCLLFLRRIKSYFLALHQLF